VDIDPYRFYGSENSKEISLLPLESILNQWQKDYEIMQGNMIYGESLPFGKLHDRIREVQHRINSKNS
jgi:hypothetical protein